MCEPSGELNTEQKGGKQLEFDPSTEKDFMILSALRGPDRSDVNNLKALFTGRIRTLCELPPMTVVRPFKMFKPEYEKAVHESVMWVQSDNEGHSHYLYHIREACRELKDFPLKALAQLFYTHDAPLFEEASELMGGD